MPLAQSARWVLGCDHRPMTGVVLPYWLDRDPLEAVAVARQAESAGFGELWVGELYHYDAFALAGALAQITDRITLTVGPLAAGVRDSLSIARGVASISVLGARPARLALGASNPTIVERFHGRQFGSEATRMSELVDSVRMTLKSAKTEQGYRSALGVHQPHISVAALGPRMRETASLKADRMVVNLVTVEQAGTLADSVNCPTVAWVVTALEPGPATRLQVATQVSHYLASPGYAEMFIEAGFGGLVERARAKTPMAQLVSEIPDALLEGVTLYGSESSIVTRAGEYRNAGVGLALVPTTAEDPAGERTLARLGRLLD